jgi:hypothetical protein
MNDYVQKLSWEKTPFWGNVNAWMFMLLTWHLVPAVFGAASSGMSGSSN